MQDLVRLDSKACAGEFVDHFFVVLIGQCVLVNRMKERAYLYVKQYNISFSLKAAYNLIKY